MGTAVIVSGNTFNVPSSGDIGWGQGVTSVNNLLIALAGAIQTAPAFMQFSLVLATPTPVTTGKTYLVDTSVIPLTLNLPAPAANIWFMVKDKKGTSVPNPITLHRAGAENIDGVALDATF